MNWFVRMITFGWPRAITLAPFGIYIKKEWFNDLIIRNKENIHWEQQTEMLILPFYLWYFIEWIIRIPINGRSAYRKIWFEQETAKNGYNLNYLEIRKHFAWL